jgi:hypothetical protein
MHNLGPSPADFIEVFGREVIATFIAGHLSAGGHVVCPTRELAGRSIIGQS